MSRIGGDALTGCPGVIGKPSRISGSGREALPDDREWSGVYPDVREWSEANKNVREWSGGPSESPRVVLRPSWMAVTCQEALPNVRVWSGGPPVCP